MGLARVRLSGDGGSVLVRSLLTNSGVDAKARLALSTMQPWSCNLTNNERLANKSIPDQRTRINRGHMSLIRCPGGIAGSLYVRSHPFILPPLFFSLFDFSPFHSSAFALFQTMSANIPKQILPQPSRRLRSLQIINGLRRQVRASRLHVCLLRWPRAAGEDLSRTDRWEDRRGEGTAEFW